MPNVYVARRRLRVGDRYVMPGDEVPEANSWYHLPTYVHNGSLALVQTDVHYARGMKQRRPQDPDRADYRVARERWHGEIQYGGGTPTPPDPCTPTITAIEPNSFGVSVTPHPAPGEVTNVVIRGTCLANAIPQLLNAQHGNFFPNLEVNWSYTQVSDTELHAVCTAWVIDPAKISDPVPAIVTVTSNDVVVEAPVTLVYVVLTVTA